MIGIWLFGAVALFLTGLIVYTREDIILTRREFWTFILCIIFWPFVTTYVAARLIWMSFRA